MVRFIKVKNKTSVRPSQWRRSRPIVADDVDHGSNKPHTLTVVSKQNLAAASTLKLANLNTLSLKTRTRIRPRSIECATNPAQNNI